MKNSYLLSLTISLLILGCSKSEESSILEDSIVPKDSNLEIFIGNYKNSFWKTEEEPRSIPFTVGGPSDPFLVVNFPFTGYFELSLNEADNIVFKGSQFWDLSDANERGHGEIYNNGGPTSIVCEDCAVTSEGYFTDCSDPGVLYFEDTDTVVTLSSNYENTLVISKKSKIDDSIWETRLVVDETASPKKLTTYNNGLRTEVYTQSSKPSYCN